MTTLRAFSLDKSGKRLALDASRIRLEQPGGICLEMDLTRPSPDGIPLYAGHVPSPTDDRSQTRMNLFACPLASNMLAIGTCTGTAPATTPAQAHQAPLSTALCASAIDDSGRKREIDADGILIETADGSALHLPLEGLFGHLLLIYGRPDADTEPDFAAWRRRYAYLQFMPCASNLAIIGTRKSGRHGVSRGNC